MCTLNTRQDACETSIGRPMQPRNVELEGSEMCISSADNIYCRVPNFEIQTDVPMRPCGSQIRLDWERKDPLHSVQSPQFDSAPECNHQLKAASHTVMTTLLEYDTSCRVTFAPSNVD